MTQLLPGLHDREAAAIAPPNTWILDTIALSENPAPPIYYPTYAWITRLNWNYGSTGTLPNASLYGEYARRAAAYVASSKGCSRWIIGNEPNLPREWPDKQPIFPWQYANCYRETRAAIHALPGHQRDEVLIAAAGPWNNELKYPGNPDGDWITNFKDTLAACGNDIDGFAIHAYTHGYSVPLVTSSARMQAPFQSRHYEFRTYRDYCEAIPDALNDKPVYLSEANGNGPWQAVGLMPAMLGEIDGWNQTHKPKIHAVIFYRYPKYDDFFIEGKTDVIAEYHAAVGKGYTSPVRESNIVQTFVPTVSTGTPAPQPSLPPRQIDPRATARGVTIDTPSGSVLTWYVTRVDWLDEAQAQGRHHLYADVLDEQGKRLVNVPLRVTWPTGESVITTEAKAGEPYAANYPLSPSRNEFSIRVDGLALSETVRGIGMGADTPGGYNAGIHTSTSVVFQRVSVTAPVIGSGPKPPLQPVLQPGVLTHPIADPALRVISQPYGGASNHLGIDFAVVTGTPIGAVDAGVVLESQFDAAGYGEYVKLRHAWGESLYGHLKTRRVEAGEPVNRGNVVGNSGSTGNSTGPHLHLAIRINPYNRGDGKDGFSNPAPYFAATVVPAQPQHADLLPLIQAAAAEFGLEWQLLASLAWAESSFNPAAVSAAGAQGLFQLMPGTFAEWKERTGATNPFDAKDNARTAASYLRYLIQWFAGNERKALHAYNWGVGNISAGRTPPAETIEFASKVIHGCDLLKAVGAK